MRRKTLFFHVSQASHIHGFSGKTNNEPRNIREIPSGSYLFDQGSQWKFG